MEASLLPAFGQDAGSGVAGTVRTVAVIGNLHDHSLAAQLALTYDTGDESRLQVGLTKPFGQRGDEFGGVTVGEGLTVGGGTRGYLRFVYFF